jgi:hypothetical protein
MEIKNIIGNITLLLDKISREIWENGELSSQSKLILKSVDINQLRSYKEQGWQMLIDQISQLPSDQQEAYHAAVDLTFIFIDEYFVKDLLDILCDNKGNYIIKKLILRTSQQIDKFVEVEDKTPLDEATYQQLKGNIRKVVRLLNSGQVPSLSPGQIENLKQQMRGVSREEIGTTMELGRKFLLKALDDPELDNYMQEIPLAWRSELKTLGKSLTNLVFGLFNRDLFYDFFPVVLDMIEQEEAGSKISQKEALDRILPLLTKHLKKWVAQKRLIIQKSPPATSQSKSLNLIQQHFQLIETSSSQQTQALQEEVSRLKDRISQLEEQARQNSNNTKLIEEKKQVQSQLGRKKKSVRKYSTITKRGKFLPDSPTFSF